MAEEVRKRVLVVLDDYFGEPSVSVYTDDGIEICIQDRTRERDESHKELWTGEEGQEEFKTFADDAELPARFKDICDDHHLPAVVCDKYGTTKVSDDSDAASELI